MLLSPSFYQYNDPVTNRKVYQLTSLKGITHHLYFTNTSFTRDGREIFFISYQSDFPNIWKLDIRTSLTQQVTYNSRINPFSPVVLPDGKEVIFTADENVIKVEVDTGREKILANFPDASLGILDISPQADAVAVAVRRSSKCQLAIISTDGSSCDIILEMKEIAHPQFDPVEGKRILFSGPVDSRLWTCNRDGTGVISLYKQDKAEWLTHESWLNGEEVLYVHWHKGLYALNIHSRDRRAIFEGNIWHACAGPSGKTIVFDTNPDEGLFVISSHGGKARRLCMPEASCKGTQWEEPLYAPGATIDLSVIRLPVEKESMPPALNAETTAYGPQWTHPHPSWSPDGEYVLYTSDRTGCPQIYLIEGCASFLLRGTIVWS